MTGRFVLLFSAAAILTMNAALSDEIHKYVKMTCIPELNYMEITTIASYTELDEATRIKYNLVNPYKIECTLFEGMKDITVKVSGGSVGGGQCGGDSKYFFTLLENDKPIYRAKGFLDHCFNPVPQIIAYDGAKIRACDDILHKCEVHEKLSADHLKK